ncbi:MAG: tail fiber domain-containing protein [Spirosomataceae bacterium]
MKRIAFLLLMTGAAYGQIYVESPTAGAITITPHGLEGQQNGSQPYRGYNIALGWKALENNLLAGSNIAIGYEALNSTSKGSNNIAIGFFALKNNFQGYGNVAIGHNVLTNNGGMTNTAVGDGALRANAGAWSNVAMGAGALGRSTAGGNNTSVGFNAGFNVKTGSNNLLLGYQADVSDTTLFNAAAIGANTIVNASNKIRLGNDQVTVVEGPVAYSFPSDRRLKENIVYTSRLGLDFITRLQTVSYNYISDKTRVRHDGFIAQDVEQVMKALGVSFSGLKIAADGTYSLAYSDFVMPLVNAVKEQQEKIERLEKQVESLLKTAQKP